MGILLTSRYGLTVREISGKLRELDPSFRFSERTIRRDCLAFEHHGLVEPRDESDTQTWKVKGAPRLQRWFADLRAPVEE